MKTLNERLNPIQKIQKLLETVIQACEQDLTKESEYINSFKNEAKNFNSTLNF
jgi:hypothetical protein